MEIEKQIYSFKEAWMEKNGYGNLKHGLTEILAMDERKVEIAVEIERFMCDLVDELKTESTGTNNFKEENHYTAVTPVSEQPVDREGK